MPSKDSAKVPVAPTLPESLPMPPRLPGPLIADSSVARVRAAWTDGNWQHLENPVGADPEDPASKVVIAARKRIGQALGSVIGAEHSVAFFGLGPSAAVGGPRMSDLWTKVKASDPARFAKIQVLVRDTTKPDDIGNIEDLLSKCQQLAHNPAGTVKEAEDFVAAAEKTIAIECKKFLGSADLGNHEHLLRVLGRRANDKPRAKVFTTNYDLCIETAAAMSGLHIIDGFGQQSVPIFDGSHFEIDFVRRRAETKAPEFLDGVVHLVKLHGSVDWQRDGRAVVRKNETDNPVLIYPRSDKFELSYQQPFLETIAQFQSVLRQPNLGLLIIGFSFSDVHLAEMIISAVRRNLSLRVMVATLGCANHCDEKDSTYRASLNSLMQLTDKGDSRISLIDCDFETLVKLVPDLGTETEEDRLRSLMRAFLK